MRRVIACLAASALACAPVAAEEAPEWMPSETALAKHLAKIGNWEFAATMPGPDGQPECRESWYFKDDGTGWAQSGQQRVTLTWRIMSTQGRRPVRLLYVTGQSSTGSPDCTGKVIDPDSYPDQEWGFFLRFTDKRSAMICGGAGLMAAEDGAAAIPWVVSSADDCWGSITAVARD